MHQTSISSQKWHCCVARTEKSCGNGPLVLRCCIRDRGLWDQRHAGARVSDYATAIHRGVFLSDLPSPGLKLLCHACAVCCLVQPQVEARIRMLEASSSQFANKQMVAEMMGEKMDDLNEYKCGEQLKSFKVAQVAS
jgi:hypothetical protein